jgi:CRP/FNR family cyclic AMP-dependent transcriptional regulator
MRDANSVQLIMCSTGWLSYTPVSFQSEILSRCRLQNFKAAEPLYQIGDPSGGMYGLVSGGLRVSVAPSDRAPYFGHFARPGAWLGEGSAITGQPRRVGLVASRPSEVLHLPLHEIERIAKDPACWRLFALVTIGHLDTAMGACDDLMIRDHSQRFIATMLRLGGCRRGSKPDGLPPEIDLSQDDVAAIANVARTTASEVLLKLEKAGHVSLSYRRVRINAPAALHAMLKE